MEEDVENRMRLVWLGLLLLVLITRSYGAEACRPLTPELRSSVTAYVVKKFKLPSSVTFELKQDSLIAGSCYRKLTFDSNADKRPLTIYLSPDQRYVVPVLFDLSVDPVAEELALSAAATKLLTSEDSPSIGDVNAPITLVEFADFQCPFCKRLTDVLRSEVLGKDEKVRVVFKNYPLPNHSWAMQAAKAAACVTFQNKDAFWQIHNYLFDHQRELKAENVRDQIANIVTGINGLSVGEFASCMDKDMASVTVSRDIATANNLQVHGTPTFFINGVRNNGVVRPEELHALLQEALQRTKQAKTEQPAEAKQLPETSQ